MTNTGVKTGVETEVETEETRAAVFIVESEFTA
jgi:hypothetical protein